LKILRPVAPAGYVALGDIAWPSHQSDPPLDYMRCVHNRYAFVVMIPISDQLQNKASP